MVADKLRTGGPWDGATLKLRAACAFGWSANVAMMSLVDVNTFELHRSVVACTH